ncbi:hypothetical protein BDZ91DRAFT_802642 [Kalaharituber pfeilii]|nr:hypothetical protein BDZ91DRAFT_802642 [Kalaharituber pfeilii]
MLSNRRHSSTSFHIILQHSTSTLLCRHRKGKAPTPDQPYEIKRQLRDEEAKKIASSTGAPPSLAPPPSPPKPGPSPKATPSPPEPTPPPPKSSTDTKGKGKPPKSKGKLPSQEEALQRHLAARKGHTTTSPPTNSDATTKGKSGIVVHGIALRKDLGKVKQWLEAANKELGKIVGIRWLRRRTILEEEGKKTSSVVVYLGKEMDVEKVRLSGRWLRSVRYETERGRKKEIPGATRIMEEFAGNTCS